MKLCAAQEDTFPCVVTFLMGLERSRRQMGQQLLLENPWMVGGFQGLPNHIPRHCICRGLRKSCLIDRGVCSLPRTMRMIHHQSQRSGSLSRGWTASLSLGPIASHHNPQPPHALPKATRLSEASHLVPFIEVGPFLGPSDLGAADSTGQERHRSCMWAGKKGNNNNEMQPPPRPTM